MGGRVGALASRVGKIGAWGVGLGLMLSLFVATVAAEETARPGLDAEINAFLAPVSDVIAAVIFVAIPIGDSELRLIVVWLILAALVFTIYLKAVNVWGFRHGLSLALGREHEAPDAPGEISHFRALTAALSGTVGLGNIAGVAVAIALGGPGAAFWMTVAGFLGMASKFVECALGMRYREVHADGSTAGGPMYYLSRGLAEVGWPRLGRTLAILFSIMCIGGAFGAGNMFQANQAYQQFVNATGGEASFLYGQGWLFGLVMAAFVALVILGGIRSIARVTARLVPFMGLIYFLGGLVVVIVNADRIPWAIAHIILEAFKPEAGFGALVGVLIVGFQRAAFSNEAGIGSAPIAYASVKTRNYLSVGFVALLEPFVDTIIICNITAFVIVVSGVYLENTGLGGVQLTSTAFAHAISWFPYVLMVAVILFAFSTIVTWSYYGLRSWTYLVGETPFTDRLFKITFCVFTVIGSAMSLDKVIQFSDAMVFAMSFPNVIGMYLLARHLRKDVLDYRRSLTKGG